MIEKSYRVKGRDWEAFLKELNKNPRKFALAVIEHLEPPKYAIEKLRKWEYLCSFCWEPRMDVCFLCNESVCEKHQKTYIGPKTELEWYVCPNCQEVHSEEEILEKVREADEQLWLEDQELEAETEEVIL